MGRGRDRLRGVEAGSTASEADIIEHCRQHLAAYKKPKSFISRALRDQHYGKSNAPIAREHRNDDTKQN